ncbi:ABC transporter permease [Haloplanus litoreus]|uniref:ABC transporter permease n=1 Tax=Haloplanus litoreus TaxID=767515 RepID=UPI003618D8A5
MPPERAVSEFVTESVRASLIPVVDAMRTLGLVYIPGMMSGMILGGANPIYAAEYQFVIMGMIFAAGGLTSMTTSLLLSRAAFTDAAQLRAFDATEWTVFGAVRAALNRR